MSRNNVLWLVVGMLTVTTAVLGYQFYQSQQQQGIEISIGAGGVSIQER